jgi:hypothetical protein
MDMSFKIWVMETFSEPDEWLFQCLSGVENRRDTRSVADEVGAPRFLPFQFFQD